MCVLETSKLFAGLSVSALERIRNVAQKRVFAAGETIFRQGERGNGLYLIAEGQVQVWALLGKEKPQTLCRMGPGEFFGEMALLEHEPRSATVTAEGEVTVYFMEKESFLELMEDVPGLAVRFLREFSGRLRDFTGQYVREVLQAERLSLVGRFARSIVHDIKNPLNIIAISTEIAGGEHASPETRKLASARVRKQVERLTSMANELLEFTRTENTAVVLGRVDYGVFIKRLVEDVGPDLEPRMVTVELENEPPEASVLIDPPRLSHLFYNLFQNATEAMPEGGKIQLRFKRIGSSLITEVEDSGPGIPPGIVPHLFEPFVTGGKDGGTGLGLSICKKIAEDHGGTIEGRNQPGSGAIFSFSLPL